MKSAALYVPSANINIIVELRYSFRNRPLSFPLSYKYLYVQINKR